MSEPAAPAGAKSGNGHGDAAKDNGYSVSAPVRSAADPDLTRFVESSYLFQDKTASEASAASTANASQSDESRGSSTLAERSTHAFTEITRFYLLPHRLPHFVSHARASSRASSRRGIWWSHRGRWSSLSPRRCNGVGNSRIGGDACGAPGPGTACGTVTVSRLCAQLRCRRRPPRPGTPGLEQA